MVTRCFSVNFDFAKARVVVTGGTTGIGNAIAKAFMAAGAEVTVTGTRPSASDYGNQVLGMNYLPLDLASTASVSAFVQSVDQVDILINNAGNTLPGADFAQVVQVNLNSAYEISNGLHPLLSRASVASGACVINLASMMSFFGSPYFPGYGAAKAGIVQLTKTLAAGWAKDGIRVNAVAPGSVPTPMTAPYAGDPAIHAMVCEKTPMARWGTPEEIASAVLFLCSDGARFVTGHTLVVDGGYSIVE